MSKISLQMPELGPPGAQKGSPNAQDRPPNAQSRLQDAQGSHSKTIEKQLGNQQFSEKQFLEASNAQDRPQDAQEPSNKTIGKSTFLQTNGF